MDARNVVDPNTCRSLKVEPHQGNAVANLIWVRETDFGLKAVQRVTFAYRTQPLTVGLSLQITH